jgi:hypothetical protein
MRAIFTRRLAALAVIAVSSVTVAGTTAQAAPRTAGVTAAGTGYTPPSGVIDPCPATAPGDAGCATLTTKAADTSADKTAARSATAASTTSPAGYTPAELQQAYNFQGATSGSGQTVAVVTAYNPEDAASDLAAYRSEYGLAPCTVADKCLELVSQTGSTTDLPSVGAGWDSPVAESVDMISAICPNCHILVVEANSPAISDLGAAENEAVTLGADFIDNDWAIPETQVGAEETTYDTDYFDHPGVAIIAPAGDDGYGVINYPAASHYVTAVGGTTLTADSSVTRGYTETAWSGTSSGCSAYEPKPTWQTDTGCADRTLNDLAADADPNTAVAYYDTPTAAGWAQGSGTVVAAAIIAASYALAGTPESGTYPPSYPYENPVSSYAVFVSPEGLNNITSGSDGTCSVSYLCTAGSGYNGPTGLGSPNTALSLSATGSTTGPFESGAPSGMCLDDYDSGTAILTEVALYSCNGSAAQNWTADSNGAISVNISGDTLCLDTVDEDDLPGVDVDLNTCGGEDSQRWNLTSTGEVINGSGLCLTDPDDSTAENTGLEIDTCASSPTADQEWTAPYDRPKVSGAITSQITTADLCINDASDATTAGTEIQVYDCSTGDDAQDWTLEPDGSIQLDNDGNCISTVGNGTSNGTKLDLTSCQGYTSQQWTERSNGTLVNTYSGTCIDDPDAATTEGTQLQIWGCNGNIQQSWTIP